MNLFLLLLLAFPFFCLALLSLTALLGVVALAGAIRVLGAIKSALGLGGRGAADDPWHRMVGEATLISSRAPRYFPNRQTVERTRFGHRMRRGVL